jgi:hypothetical protein
MPVRVLSFCKAYSIEMRASLAIYHQTRYQPQENESCRFGRALRVVVAILFLLQVELEGGRECVYVAVDEQAAGFRFLPSLSPRLPHCPTINMQASCSLHDAIVKS